jgi:hypothetical protein
MIDLDHVSFGTHDALATAQRLRRDYGATAVFGETLPEFRYLTLYLGTAEEGGFFELLDAKISLLGKKIHSQRERGLEVRDYETRHEYLVKTREELRQTINDLDGEEFKVRCQLTVDNA